MQYSMDQSIWNLEYFSKIANKTMLVNKAECVEPILFQNSQLLGVNNCRINVIEC